jgi:hypothetical protein
MAHRAHKFSYCSIDHTDSFPRINIHLLVFQSGDAHPGLGLENNARG